MARNIGQRLAQLKTRRQGLDRLTRVASPTRAEILAKSLNEEAYQRRAPAQPYTRYALGSMQEVGPEYTRISVEEAERVGRQLEAGLTPFGISVAFRLQGSVPC